MNLLKATLLILGLTTLVFGHLPPNYLFRPKHVSRNNYLYLGSPNFDYPLFQQVDKNLAKIPNDVYPGQIYTGYVPITDEDAHIYYVLYPARGDSDAGATLNNSAPLIMWMQGGPGCADWLGNFDEIGPLQIIHNGKDWKVVKAEINWNSDYNLLFIDQPPGVGFSPAGTAKYTDSMQAGQTVVKFLQSFFNIYTSLKKNPFHIFGESYAGHYIPAVASQLVAKQAELGIKLSGVGIGNGLTDPYHQVGGYSQFGYAASLLSTQKRASLAVSEAQARKEFAAGNYSGVAGLFDDIIGVISDPKVTGVFSPYDYRDGPSTGPSPYSIYLDDANVRKAFALDPAVKFSDCADAMYEAFYADIGQSYASNITYLLDKGIPVLLYNGEDDIIINNHGARTWIKNLDWQYTHQFINAQTRTLNDKQGNVLGTTKTYKQLTFAVIYKAGHAVPTYQPLSSKIMLDNFIKS